MTIAPEGAFASAAPAPAPFHLWRSICAALHAWRLERQTRALIASLDDHQLRDIGLDPYDVPRADTHGAAAFGLW